jgi:signal transduction histidine kinase/CheY-like chemotaxis protein
MDSDDRAQASVALDLSHLRAPALVALCIATITVAWIWLIILFALEFSGLLLSMRMFRPPATLLLTASICLLLNRLPQIGRSAMFIFGTSLALFVGLMDMPSATWIYYYSLIVLAAALLIRPAISFAAVFAFSVASMRYLDYGAAAGTFSEPRMAVALLFLTACVAWLLSRSLHTALDWALNSQRQAWETANEVRQRRAELHAALHSLEMTCDLLDRSNRDLQIARRRAEEAQQLKARFVANVSHELRTPLNIIVGFAEMLSTLPESYGEFAWLPELREDLFIIWRNAEHLLKMVDDVLDLAQMEAARLPVMLETTAPAQFVRDSLKTLNALLRDSRLELRMALPEDLPLLNMDQTRIRQVLLNLVSNAVRHTREGYIEVGAHCAEQEVVFYVQDSGQGIPRDKLELIFEEFEQADTSLRRPHEGAGLGLAVSRRLVELHGGRLWAESEVGRGSTFSFALPLPEVQSERPSRLRRTASLMRPEQEAERPALVLTRDDLAVRLLRRYLERPIVGVESLADAVAQARMNRPAFALVMPDDAAELPRAVEEARSLLDAIPSPDLPVMVCQLPTERRASHILRVPEVLIKPVTRNQLVSAIRRIVPEPQRILIVDDDIDMVQLLRRMIGTEWAHAEILSTTRGSEALTLAAQRPDLLLLDLLMPGMSGLDVLTALRSDPDTARLPVIVITARGPAEDVNRLEKGELVLLKNRSMTAEELIRVLQGLTQSLKSDGVVL